LPKETSAATTTINPKKRRMASGLDVVMKSTKTPAPASTEASDKKIEDVREAAAASASSIHGEAGPSGVVTVELVKENLLEKPASPVPEAPPRVIWTILFDMLRKSSYQQIKLPKCNILLRS
jgi:hypothetical protein